MGARRVRPRGAGGAKGGAGEPSGEVKGEPSGEAKGGASGEASGEAAGEAKGGASGEAKGGAGGAKGGAGGASGDDSDTTVDGIPPYAYLKYTQVLAPGQEPRNLGDMPLVIALRKHVVKLGRLKENKKIDHGDQPCMVSRWHATIKFRERSGKWRLYDNGSKNGTLLQRKDSESATRVSEASLKHGDVITFGGAVSTEVGESPAENAVKSIYTYRFIT